jgi:molecular chaperone GrpE
MNDTNNEPVAENDEPHVPPAAETETTPSATSSAATDISQGDASQAKPEVAPSPAPEAKVAELEDRYLRLLADFENYRRRITREKQEWDAQALQRIAHDLLSVADHFDRGLETASSSGIEAAVLDGFRMVHQQLMTTLQRVGVVPLEADGLPFNHAEHEAVTSMPSQDVPADHVAAVVRKGYRLGERLLRPAQVVVSTGTPVSPENA